MPDYFNPPIPTKAQADAYMELKTAIGCVEALLLSLPDSTARERTLERLFETEAYAYHAALAQARSDEV